MDEREHYSPSKLARLRSQAEPGSDEHAKLSAMIGLHRFRKAHGELAYEEVRTSYPFVKLLGEYKYPLIKDPDRP